MSANEHSLPDVEQVRTEAVIASGNDPNGVAKTNKKKQLILITVAVLAIAMIISLSAAIAARNNDNGSAEASNSGLKNSQNGGSRDPDLDLKSEARFRDVVDFLADTYSSRTALETVDTPQNMAAKWIADTDTLKMDIPASQDYDVVYGFLQRYVAAVMYYALDGGNWDDSLKFLTMDSVCDWTGQKKISERPGHPKQMGTIGIQCNDNGEVNYIFLPENGLEGTLPDEIGLLEAVQHFSVVSNNISGPFPDTMRFWTKLTLLAVESNQMTGNVPTWLTGMQNLQFLALGHNGFAGELPNFGDLPYLKEITIQNNDLVGSFDVFNGLTGLKMLMLQNNDLTGEIKADTFANVPLKILDLSDNKISGSIPADFYSCHVVDLHNNQITGPLPDVDSTDYKIQFLSVYNNQLSGGIPDTIHKLAHLTHLDLSDCGLEGEIHQSFESMVSLVHLYLGGNNFTPGRMPTLLQLENLEELSLREANLIGHIPRWTGEYLTNLVMLDLRGNALNQTIPETLGDIPSLHFLLLDRNTLTGAVPHRFWHLEHLSILTLDHNNLEGTVGKVCEANGPTALEYLVADDAQCADDGCPCCKFCCDPSDDSCNSGIQTPNLDGTYIRSQFVFSDQLVFDSNGDAPEGGSAE